MILIHKFDLGHVKPFCFRRAGNQIFQKVVNFLQKCADCGGIQHRPQWRETGDCKERDLAFTTHYGTWPPLWALLTFKFGSIRPSELIYRYLVEHQGSWRARRSRRHGNQWTRSSRPTSANRDVNTGTCFYVLKKRHGTTRLGSLSTSSRKYPLEVTGGILKHSFEVYDPHKICF